MHTERIHLFHQNITNKNGFGHFQKKKVIKTKYKFYASNKLNFNFRFTVYTYDELSKKISFNFQNKRKKN